MVAQSDGTRSRKSGDCPWTTTDAERDPKGKERLASEKRQKQGKSREVGPERSSKSVSGASYLDSVDSLPRAVFLAGLCSVAKADGNLHRQ
jgi:hypothetical protein